MNDFWFNIMLEIGLLILLGVLYYFYQRKKILSYEADKGPLLMGYILQCCLSERGDTPSADLDPVIEALDDYLHNRTPTPPVVMIEYYLKSEKGTPELRDVMREALLELEGDGKK
jgi:hypothetical protein